MNQTEERPQIAPSIEFRAVVDGKLIKNPIQSDLLVFTTLHMKDKRVCPSVREIANGIGVGSNLTVQHALKCLKFQGVLDWTEKTARSIRFLKDVKLAIVHPPS
jgi:SOS-response transcriptional repressor LexA